LFADGAEAWANAALFAPLAVVTGELGTLVGDDVPRSASSLDGGASEERANLTAAGLLLEDAKGEEGTGVVIEDEGDVSGESPLQDDGERPPRDPVAGGSGYRRDVDVPQLVRTFRGDDSFRRAAAAVRRSAAGFTRLGSRRLGSRRVGQSSLLHALDGAGSERETRATESVGELAAHAPGSPAGVRP
jgi:hypothetical protein